MRTLSERSTPPVRLCSTLVICLSIGVICAFASAITNGSPESTVGQATQATECIERLISDQRSIYDEYETVADQIRASIVEQQKMYTEALAANRSGQVHLNSIVGLRVDLNLIRAEMMIVHGKIDALQDALGCCGSC